MSNKLFARRHRRMPPVPCMTLFALEPRLLLAGDIHINFQPAAAPTYAGYLVDAGDVYGVRSGGLSYGWNANNTANTRDRNSATSLDQRYDTFNHMQKNGTFTWEVEVPNGQYNVTIVAGDAGFNDSVFRINAESTLVVNGTPTSSNRWITGSATVTVADGRLTVSNGTGASNNKICFIDIVPLAQPPAAPSNLAAAASSSSQINLTWTDNANNETGFEIDRSTTSDFSANVTTTTAAADATSASITGLNSSTTYYFRVRALNGALASAYSSSASAATLNAAPTIATAASANPNPVTASTATLTVLGADDLGEGGLNYTWSVVSKPASAANPTFSVNGTNAAKSTVATFTSAGAYTFRATATDAGSLSATSDVVVTVNQTLTSIVVTPASVTLNNNSTQQFTASGRDQFGAALTVQPTFTWSLASGIGSVNTSGLYTAPATGTGTASVQAASAGITGTGAVTVSSVNNAPTVVNPAAVTPNPVTGTSAALSALGADDGGEAALRYTWSVVTKPSGSINPKFSVNGTNAAKNVTASFNRAGSYTLRVTIADAANQTVTSDVTFTINQTLTSVYTTPANANLTPGQTQQFTSVTRDQFGVNMASQPAASAFTYSLLPGSAGTLSATGLYTAPATNGQATIQVSYSGLTDTAVAFTLAAAPATPGENTPSASSYLGDSTDTDAVRGTQIQSDGTIILAVNSLVNPSGVSATLLNGATNSSAGAIVRMSADGKTVLSVTRISAGVYDLSLDGANNIYVAAHGGGLIKLNSTATSVLFTKAVNAVRVDAAPNGDVVVLGGGFAADGTGFTTSGTHYVYDAAGTQLGSFASFRREYDVAIDSVTQSVFTTGFNQVNGPSGNPVQISYLRSQAYNGTQKWKGYDWTAAQVDDPAASGGAGPTNNMADSRGVRLDMGDDGKLYVAYQVAGGNHIFRYDPFNLFQGVNIVGGDTYHNFSNTRSEHKTFFARYEPSTGAYLTGQQITNRNAAAEGNTIYLGPGGDIQADKFGRVYLAGSAASGTPLTFDPIGPSVYTGGAFLYVMSQDFKTRLLVTRLSGNGASYGVAARVIGSENHARIAFGGRTGTGLWTLSPVQGTAASATQDGFFAVFSLGQNITSAATITASSTAAGSVTNLTDGNAATSWQGAAADPQTVTLDLGTVRVLSSLTLNWGSNYARNFVIDYSTDGTTWTSLYSTTSGAGGVQNIIKGTAARYLRITLNTRNSAATGAILNEITLWGV